MTIPIRKSIRIILLNEKNEILLMSADDPNTTTIDGKSRGRFWFLIGGEIEDGESIENAATRELYEETGLTNEHVEFGPIVWHGEYDLILSGTPTRLRQKFLVAKTNCTDVSLKNLTETEKTVIDQLDWFSLEKIRSCKDAVYPTKLAEYLEAILEGNYPQSSIEIELG